MVLFKVAVMYLKILASGIAMTILGTTKKANKQHARNAYQITTLLYHKVEVFPDQKAWAKWTNLIGDHHLWDQLNG